jgi:hypothetical protein
MHASDRMILDAVTQRNLEITRSIGGDAVKSNPDFNPRLNKDSDGEAGPLL